MCRLQHKAVVLLLCLLVLPTSRAVALRRPAIAQGHQDSAQNVVMRLASQIRKTSLDCSHLVHYLYNRVGLPYTYAESRRLYNGVSGFVRVLYPKPGDLIVWRGHVGIVVDPAERSFVSALRTGVKVAQYDSRYWKSRGKPRFFRYAGESTPTTDTFVSNRRELDNYVTFASVESADR
jgi:hypothetical protein